MEHGGKRKRAGRPPAAEGAKRVTGSITLLPEYWAELDALVDEEGLSGRGDAVAHLLDTNRKARG